MSLLTSKLKIFCFKPVARLGTLVVKATLNLATPRANKATRLDVGKLKYKQAITAFAILTVCSKQ